MKLNRCIYKQDIMDYFERLGFENISYSNDLCDSIGLSLDNDKWSHYFQIFLANSKTNNIENENFSTSILQYYQNSEMQVEYTFDDIYELLSMFTTYNLTERNLDQ